MGYNDIKELLKDAKNMATGANDLQLKSLLLDIQDKVFELQEENRKLRDEIHELRNVKLIDSQLEFKNNAYYKIGAKIPYCSKCYEVDRKLVTLSATVPMYSTTYVFNCPNCKNEYDSGIEHKQNTTLDF